MLCIYNYVTFGLAETRKRRKQEVNVLIMELQEEYRRIEEELRRTQAECVLCGLKSIGILYIQYDQMCM